MMKLLYLATALNVLVSQASVATLGGQAVLHEEQAPVVQKYLIELAPGERRWVTEDEKWEIRRAGQTFMDVTETPDIGTVPRTYTSVKFPEKPAYNSSIRLLFPSISKKHMRENLETLTSFHTRYYKSSYGKQSSQWLLDHVNHTVANSSALSHGASVRAFPHSWGQDSVIAKIPGRSNKTIVLGAHQDSINLFLPSLLAAPGADDDGSGTVTIWEALRVLLTSPEIVAGNASNTLEFHFYSAEEGGLLGSAAIFSAYEKSDRDVRAMLQQDMTGYTKAAIDAGQPESLGVITDYVSKPLTGFAKKIIDEYCDIGFLETKCGYACSDHASASKANYPSAFVIESEFKYNNGKVHTTEDKIDYLSFDHMKQHVKFSIAFAYELAFTDFDEVPL